MRRTARLLALTALSTAFAATAGARIANAQPAPRGGSGFVTSGNSPATIRVTSPTDGAQVYLDGALVGPAPATLRNVTPGTHEIEVRADFYRSVRRSVTVTAGQSLDLDAPALEPVNPPNAQPAAPAAPAAPPSGDPGIVTPGANPQGPPPPPSGMGSMPPQGYGAGMQPQQPPQQQRPVPTAADPIGPITIAGGIASMGLGGILWIVSESSYQGLRNRCLGASGCTIASATSQRNTITSLDTAGLVFLVGGAGLTALGVILTLTVRHPLEPVAPAVGPMFGLSPSGGATFGLQGRF